MAFALSNMSSPRVSPGGVVILTGAFVGGGTAANCTKVSGTGQGITSLAYDGGTGLYKLTFDGVAGKYLGPVAITVMAATGASNTVVMRPRGAVTGTHAYDHGSRTLLLEVTDMGATPAAKDLTTGDEVFIAVAWEEHGETRLP
jgi:hypothetical protein